MFFTYSKEPTNFSINLVEIIDSMKEMNRVVIYPTMSRTLMIAKDMKHTAVMAEYRLVFSKTEKSHFSDKMNINNLTFLGKTII